MKPEEFVKAIEDVFKPSKNPKQANAMENYMKNLFPFFGIPKPLRHKLTKPIIANLKNKISEEWLSETLYLLWQESEREYQYLGLELIKRHKKLLSQKSLNTLEYLITHKSWWDTVDLIADHGFGEIMSKCPENWKVMVKYGTDQNMWLRRTSLLFQLSYKHKTNFNFLKDRITENWGDKDFFIRKAIGWTLRQYAKVSAEEVYLFVDINKDKLSPLSIKEALKHKV